MAIYVQVNEPNSHYEKFDGMSQSIVENMLLANGKSYTIRSQANWDLLWPPGNAIYVFAGQSNSVNLATQEGDNLTAAMGTSNATHVDTGVGGTPMSRWMVGGDLYNAMLSDITAAKSGKAAPWIDGLIFWQGESDVAEGSTSIEAWPQRFINMVADFRTQINDPKRRVVFVQITNTGGTDRDRLRFLQSQISIPNVTMVVTDGITQVGDHTDTAGYLTMRQRIVAALKAMP